MSMSWSAPAGVLVERSDAGWAGIWSLTFAAGVATVSLAAQPGADPDLALAFAGADLNAALCEVEAVHPEVLGEAAAVDLGPADAADPAAAAGVIVALLDGAIVRVAELTGAPGLAMAELIALARVQPLLLAGREKVAGGGSV